MRALLSARRLLVAIVACAAFAVSCAGHDTTPGVSQSGPQSANRTMSQCAKGSHLRDGKCSLASLTLPPMGMYANCEIDTNLTASSSNNPPGCESQDSAIGAAGFSWEINYLGMMATATGPESLAAWFAYDATASPRPLGQAFAVADLLNDTVDPLTGTRWVACLPGQTTDCGGFNGDASLATSCGATNNEQVLQCIYTEANATSGFQWMWYIYDEPGCPESNGYCDASQPVNYNYVSELANYIATMDPSHKIIGTQVGDIASPAIGTQALMDNMFDWLIGSVSPSPMPATADNPGFDRYPIPTGSTAPGKGTIADVGTIATDIANTFNSYNTSANTYYVGQAFSWYQESATGCTGLTNCPMPTEAQEQKMRDEALWYASQKGYPPEFVFWWWWPDVMCNWGNGGPHDPSGCDATSNLSHLETAITAPYPTSSPFL